MVYHFYMTENILSSVKTVKYIPRFLDDKV